MKNTNNHKEHIKAKAAELFFQYGLKTASMDEIAERSGISKKTLYLFFSNKTEIIGEVVDDLIKSHDHLFESIRLTAEDAIQEVLKQETRITSSCKSVRPRFFYELEMFFPEIWKLVEQYKLKVQRSIEKNLQRGKEELLYRNDLNISVISELRLQQLTNLLRPHILTNLKLNVRELADEITLLYLRSITTEKGSKQLQTYLEEQN